MTISTEAIKSSVFAGNGSTTGFAISFKTFSQSDLTVTLTNSAGVETVKSLTTHYTVSLNSNQDVSPGGTVTMGTPPASGEKLVIANEPAYTQSSDIVNGGGFFPNVIEDMVDRNTILSRRAQEQTSRSIQIPISDSTGTTVKLPTETLRANKAIVFDADGDVGVSVDNYVDQVATVASSATAAASSAAAASSSASAAATSATNAATSYDNFDDRFLGAKSSDPSVDNDGDALITGCLYFNSSNNVMMVYTGSAWVRTVPSSSDQTHINTVSGIQANVTTVAGISSNVTTVAGISSNVTSVAGIASDVTAVAGDATDIGAVAAKATEIGRLGTADAVADMALLGTTACVADMAILGTSDVVTDMNTLGHADVVTDMNTLGTADVVSDMNTLASSAIVTDMDLLATSANVTAMGHLGTSANVTAMGLLGTSAVVTDMGILGTADVVSDMNTLGTADVVSDMNTLGTGANVTAMATCATNIAEVNNFANVYRIASSDPVSSLDEGDLVFRTDTDTMRVYNGSAWQNVAPVSAVNVFGTLAVSGQSNIVADSTTDTLTFAGSNITITTDASTDTVTFTGPAAGASTGLAIAMAVAL